MGTKSRGGDYNRFCYGKNCNCVENGNYKVIVVSERDDDLAREVATLCCSNNLELGCISKI